MIIPVCATFRNGVYTASLSYRAPFPLDFWGIYVIGNGVRTECKAKFYLSFAEVKPTFALQISETTERRTCDAGSGTHCWQRKKWNP
jgi:hypothetical protein